MKILNKENDIKFTYVFLESITIFISLIKLNEKKSYWYERPITNQQFINYVASHPYLYKTYNFYPIKLLKNN